LLFVRAGQVAFDYSSQIAHDLCNALPQPNGVCITQS